MNPKKLFNHVVYFSNLDQLTPSLYNLLLRNSVYIEGPFNCLEIPTVEGLCKVLKIEYSDFILNIDKHHMSEVSVKDPLKTLRTASLREAYQVYLQELETYTRYMRIKDYWSRLQKFIEEKGLISDTLTTFLNGLLTNKFYLSTDNKGGIRVDLVVNENSDYQEYITCLDYETKKEREISDRFFSTEKRFNFLRNNLEAFRPFLANIQALWRHIEIKEEYASLRIISFQHLTLSPGLFSESLGSSDYILESKIDLLRPGTLSDIFESIKRQLYTQDQREIPVNLVLRVCLHLTAGILIGDFGYALLLFTVSTIVFTSGYIGKVLYSLFLEISLTITLTGVFIYEEFFGYHLHLGMMGLNKVRDFNQLVKITVGLGAGLLLTMSSIGIINGFILGNTKHSLIEASRACFVFFIALYFWANRTSQLNYFTNGFLLLFAISSLSILIYNYGALGIVKLPSFFIDYLSFARLPLLSLIKASIVNAINNLIGPTVSSNPLLLVLWLFLQGGVFLWGLLTVFTVTLRFALIELLPRGCAKKASIISFLNNPSGYPLEDIPWLSGISH